MTREEAIRNITHAIRWDDMPKKEALEMALKALEKTDVPDTNAGDLISRQAVLDLKTIAPIAPVMNGEDVHYEEVIFVRDLERLPSVEPERKPGKWIHMVGWWECNQCHAEYTDMPTCMGKVIYEYCPNCGAPMEVANDT